MNASASCADNGGAELRSLSDSSPMSLLLRGPITTVREAARTVR